MQLRLIIILLAGLFAVSLAYIAWQRESTERLLENRFFDYEYRPLSGSIVTRWKKDGKIESVGFDRNDDYEMDSLVYYGRDQHVVTIWVDDDFNGIHESQYIYSRDQELIASYEDLGQDGHFDQYTRYTADSLIVYRDDNENGWFEESEVIRREVRVR